MINPEFKCYKCKRNLLSDKAVHHYVAVGDEIETVCNKCYKYIYLSNNGFKKKE